MRSIQYLTLDINKRTQQTITANTGEIGSRFVKIQIIDNDKPMNLTGVNVYLYALKSDNTKLFNTVDVEDDIDGIVLAELTSQLLVQPGNVKLTLVLTERNSKLASKEFILNVESSIFNDGAIESTNEFTALTTSLTKVKEWDDYFGETSGQIEQKYTERLNDLDEQFNTIENQKLDKNGLLSMANMGQDVKEAMTGGSVAVVGKDAILNQNIVKRQVTADKTDFLELDSVNLYNFRNNEIGKILNNNGTLTDNSTYSSSDYIEVTEGKTIYMSLDGVATTKVLRVVGFNASLEFVNTSSNFAKTYTVPIGVKYIRITGLTTDLNSQLQIEYDKITAYSKYDNFKFDGSKIKEKSIDINSLNESAKSVLPFSPKALLKNFDKDCIEFLEIKSDISKEFYFVEMYNQHTTSNSRGFKISSTDGTITISKVLQNATDNVYPSEAELIRVSNELISLTIKINWSKVITFIKGEVNNTLISNYVVKELNSSNDDIRVVVPPIVPIVVGKEMNIYYNNIVMNADADKLQDIFIQATAGATRFKDRFRFIPQSSGISTKNVKFATVDKSKIRVSNDFTINRVDANAGNGITKKVMIIGDSKTETQNYITDTLIELFNEDVMNIEFLGSRGTGLSRHEGRMSWDSNNYLYDENYASATNSFYNPNSVNDYKFDFSYYMQQQGYTNVDYVFINLGTNDTARYDYDKIVENYNKIINNIHSYNSNIKICLGMAENRCTRKISTYTLGLEKETILGWCERMISEFSNKNNVYLVPLYLNLDLENDFKMTDIAISSRNPITQKFVSDTIHPAICGFQKSADVIYYFIKYLATL